MRPSRGDYLAARRRSHDPATPLADRIAANAECRRMRPVLGLHCCAELDDQVLDELLAAAAAAEGAR